MGIEIEHRFMFDFIPSQEYFTVYGVLRITQGYFKNHGRIRLVESSIHDNEQLKSYLHYDEYFSTKNSAFITFKCKNYQEFEYAIPFSDGVHILQEHCNQTKLIRKHRYVGSFKFKCGDIGKKDMWEFDDFKDELSGLYIAELEVPNMSYSVCIPDMYDHPLYRKITDVSNMSNNYIYGLSPKERETFVKTVRRTILGR